MGMQPDAGSGRHDRHVEEVASRALIQFHSTGKEDFIAAIVGNAMFEFSIIEREVRRAIH
jgi:hypothetical protein